MTNLQEIIDFLNEHSKPFAKLPEKQKPEIAEQIKVGFKNLLIETETKGDFR